MMYNVVYPCMLSLYTHELYMDGIVAVVHTANNVQKTFKNLGTLPPHYPAHGSSAPRVWEFIHPLKVRYVLAEVEGRQGVSSNR